MTDLPAEDNLEDIEEISSGPMMTEDKLVSRLETPEYQDNIIVPVNREDFFKYPIGSLEDSRIEFCADFADTDVWLVKYCQSHTICTMPHESSRMDHMIWAKMVDHITPLLNLL